jgi:hypothetical protein
MIVDGSNEKKIGDVRAFTRSQAGEDYHAQDQSRWIVNYI